MATKLKRAPRRTANGGSQQRVVRLLAKGLWMIGYAEACKEMPSQFKGGDTWENMGNPGAPGVRAAFMAIAKHLIEAP